ncbi:hypothetical protein Tco_0471476 [Tanacetum coccineum]
MENSKRGSIPMQEKLRLSKSQVASKAFLVLINLQASKWLFDASKEADGDRKFIAFWARCKQGLCDNKENKGNEAMASSNVINSELGLQNVSNTLGDASRKSATFRTLLAPAGNGADVAISIESILELKDTLVVDIPKFEGEGYTRSTICNLKMPRQATRGPPVGLKPKPNFVYRPVQPTNKTSGKKKQVGFTRQEVSNSNPFDVLNMVENDDDLGTNRGNSKLAKKGADDGVVSSAHGHGSSPVASTTPLVEKINKLERQIDSDVEVAYDETAQFMASRCANDASLHEDEDYDIYDTYDIEGLTKQESTLCEMIDINIRGRSRR